MVVRVHEQRTWGGGHWHNDKHEIDGEGCVRRQLTTANATIDKLPKCWRLADGKLAQDCPIAGCNGYYFLCPKTGPRRISIKAIDFNRELIKIIAWAAPPYLQGEETVGPENLYRTHAAALAAQEDGK